MKSINQFPAIRLRRLRNSARLRALVREHQIDIAKLVFPLFIRHGVGIKQPILSMPGHFQLSIDQLSEEIKLLQSLGINKVILFEIPAEKDPLGKDSYSDNGIIQSAIAVIRKMSPDMLIMTDVCFC